MDTTKYFAELPRILGKNGIETAPPEKNTLPVLLNGHPAFRVEPSGELCKFPSDLDSPASSDFYFKVAPISRMVKEYMTAMEQAPLLEATALDEEFRLFTEFNGAVLAGRETQHGYKFVTWERDYDGTGVMWGHYYMDNYMAAKQDFAIRAGLIEKQRLFTNEQLIDIYQSVNDTFDAGYELTEKDAQQLTDIQQQIEAIIPDINQQIYEMTEESLRRSQEQSM